MAASNEKTPMRLAIKLGVSFALTTTLPKKRVNQVSRFSNKSLEVLRAGINSARCIYRGGLKKCTPQKLLWCCAGSTSHKELILRPDVLLTRMDLSDK